MSNTPLALFVGLLLVGSAYGQALTLYRDPTTDVAPVGVFSFRPQTSTPTAPTTGAILFSDASKYGAPSILHCSSTEADVIVSSWHGAAALDEVSTQSTNYTTAVTLSVTVDVPGTYSLMAFCEVAGSDTSTRVYVEADVDITNVLSEVNFGFDETYTNGGWRPYSMSVYCADVPAGAHVFTLRYKVTNGAKTGYLRRARVQCLRVN
jgi:hypothetical protein